MATLTIRDLEDSLKQDLRVRAAQQGHSMEEEARQILRRALQPQGGAPDLAARIRARFGGLGDVELPIPQREPVRDAGLFQEGSSSLAAVSGPATRRQQARRRP